MGDCRPRIFLKIVGRQPVIFIAHKSLKEAPGAPGYDPSCAKIFRRKRLRPGGAMAADISSDQRRQRPGCQEWNGQRQRPIPEEGDRDQARRRNRLSRPHKAKEGAGIVLARLLCFRRGNPFKQMFVRDKLAIDGANNGIAHQAGLMSQKTDH